MSESGIPGYKILKKIGKGGMARVFMAIQLAVGRTIAIKVLPKKMCKDNSFSRLFLREANCGVLNHPNIITIYDAGETQNHYYIAMEYLQGGDLKHKIKSRLRQDEVLSIVTKLSEALAYAHSKGFIHRDIKPSNILFNEDKQPILADFGIAKAINFNEQTVTDGMILGTPHYSSPEQVSSDVVDQRTDLYSLGVVYYEMLTGQKPFVAETPYALIFKHLEEPPPKLETKYKEHEPIVHKLMAKKPEERYASAFDLIEDLTKLAMAKKEQAAMRSARLRTYKNGVVLLTLVLAFSVIVSDNLQDYTQQKLIQIRNIAAKAATLSKAFVNELEEKRILVAEQEKQIETLRKQIEIQNIVSVYLEKAASYMEMGQYITPKSTSALTEYMKALAIDPGNVQARNGVGVITNHYYLLARNEVTKGALFEALDFIDSGLIASPHDEELTAMRDSIINRLDVSEKRMRLERELLIAKNMMKHEEYEQAIEKLEFLQTMSKNNQRIISLLTLARSRLEQSMSVADKNN